MNDTIRNKAREIVAKLDATKFTVDHQPTLFAGLMELAEVCGTKLERPSAYANGEVRIVTELNDEGNKCSGCRPYGVEFAALLRQVRCRTGAIEYGYKAMMIPENGWCYVPYWDAENIIRIAAL